MSLLAAVKMASSLMTMWSGRYLKHSAVRPSGPPALLGCIVFILPSCCLRTCCSGDSLSESCTLVRVTRRVTFGPLGLSDFGERGSIDYVCV